MALTSHQAPSSTNPHAISETNTSHHHIFPQPPPPPPPQQVSPTNKENSNSLPRLTTSTDELRIITARTNEQDPTTEPSVIDDEEFFKKNRGWLMIVAILAAGSSYQAGLNPPGSFWQDTTTGHVAGNPILHDNSLDRYQAFYFCNAGSFVCSLVIIILLMTSRFFSDPIKVKVLKITMILDLFSFMMAYAAGSCRTVKSSVIIFALIGLVFLYVIVLSVYYTVLRNLCKQVKSTLSFREVCPV